MLSVEMVDWPLYVDEHDSYVIFATDIWSYLEYQMCWRGTGYASALTSLRRSKTVCGDFCLGEFVVVSIMLFLF